MRIVEAKGGFSYAQNPIIEPVNTEQFRAIISGRANGAFPTLFRGVAWGVSLVFGLVVRVRRELYDRRFLPAFRVDVPVICIGNLTTGGTGKTPCVAYAAKVLQNRGLKVGILSRGYGSKDGHNGDQNDEARLLGELLPGCPHVQNPDRVAGAKELSGMGVDLILMDDGFSHRRLLRDADIVLIDATCPFGYGHLLPRGLLREPVSSLRRARGVIVTRADQVDEAELNEIRSVLENQGVSPDRTWLTTHAVSGLKPLSGPAVVDLDVKGSSVALLSGIGNPESFSKSVEGLGARVVEHRVMADHFAYDEEWIEGNWEKFERDCRELGASAIIVTAKDAVKLKGRIPESSLPVFTMEIELSFVERADEFDALLFSIAKS